MPELKHIVCIDDEPDILELVTLTLETVGGYKVTAFPSGKTAIDSIEGVDPDLIIIDSMMPDLSGIDTLNKLRKKTKLASTPFIFMTARVQQKEQEECLKAGAIAVIPKPFDPMTLPDQVQAIWNKANNT